MITNESFHKVAQSAFDSMRETASIAGTDTTEFGERQFVFELGNKFQFGAATYGQPIWVGYEYRYPKGQEKSERDKTRCDITLKSPTDEVFAWIEVKSTGINYLRTTRGNRFSS
mgnify:CR=1 FL=1